ncbi:MAG: hypothetical protein JNM86_02325 [Phycisphaerae bacterium]|nr:hypothetical protein [Phycisphaerae bacterium]MBN8598969.1 hypothetical protein [Planctomycetota bacterium]
MIRITRQQAASRETVFRVEGTLDAEGVRELRAIIASSAVQAPFTLDIAGVTSLPPAGSSFLKDLQHNGCRLTGGSMYINRLLGVVQS